VLILKILIVVFVAALAIVLGGMAAAWRRACVVIAYNVSTWRWIEGRGGAKMPLVRDLSQEDIIRYTPTWVSARHSTALFLLCVTVVLAFIWLPWYFAVATAVGTYALMELAGFMSPNRNSLYYVAQVHDTFSKLLHLSERGGHEAAASDFRERLQELEGTYKKYFLEQSQNG
jgi:hypothetical protein